ncbi:MAG: HAMP domain-containing histidine kinase [Micrococcales bacterium]|nr:HAMP domain-containing histidine kinase [Micrococcales bacterium]
MTTPDPAAPRVRTWPLWARLAAITTALVAAGLLLAGVLSTTLLQRFLVEQVDTRLTAQGEATARSTLLLAVGDRHGPIPTDYAVLISVGDDSDLFIGDWGADRYGVPNLPRLTADEAQATGQQPFTVTAEGSSATWRAVAYPLQVAQQAGSVVVALPLGDVEQTTRQTTVVLLGSGAAIVLVGALAGGLAVRRSLRPLRQIEATAAAIAAGDLSQRVPTAPLSTEVGRLGAALNGMLAQIEQAFADRSASEARMRRFVADASHELRTPLAAVRGYAELYRTGGPTALDAREALARVEESANRMAVLVEDLLTLARLDDGPSQGRPTVREPVDLVVIAGDALSDLHALDPTRTVGLVGLTGQVAPCLVLGDEHQLRQVLTNLVGNVARHTPAGSPVELAVGHDYGAGPAPGLGIVEVRDHGPGIPPEHAAQVFERFYRVDPSRTRDSGGAGLGLAIVAAVVAAHHGDVAVAATPDGGTTVRVRLPLAGLGTATVVSDKSPG